MDEQALRISWQLSPTAMGEVTNYVSQHEDARMCSVLDNPLATFPRTKITLWEMT